MFSFRRLAPAQPAICEAANADETGLRTDQILRSLDLLAAGKYLSIPAGDCPISRKLRQLADSLHERGLAEAGRVVETSVQSTEAVTAAAEMMREVTEVDRRAQAIAAATEELVSSVHEISRNAGAASDAAQSAQRLAGVGQRAADQAVSSMENIAQAVDGAAHRVANLSQASAQIGDIVNQIEAIATQTNLLALNATIEAARAGEAGKGFAVVANEVKHLANQTAKATVDIRARIEHLRTEMGTIVASMQDGAAAVEEGRSVIAENGQGMRELGAQIDSLSGRMQDISAILTQQAGASQEVAEAIGAIAHMTENNVAAINTVIDLIDRAEPLVRAAMSDLTGMELKDLTLYLAKCDHMAWRKNLAEMLVGKTRLDPAELSDHHTCRLGKWYDAVAEQGVRGHRAFSLLDPPHRDVHAHGIEAARLYRLGDVDGAVGEVQLAAEASKGVMRYLDELILRGPATN